MSTIAFTMMKAVSFFLVFTLSMSAEAVSDKKVKAKAGGGEVLCDTALLRSFTSDEFHIYVDVDGKRLSSYSGYPGSINGLIDKNAIDTILIPTKVEDLTAYHESGKWQKPAVKNTVNGGFKVDVREGTYILSLAILDPAGNFPSLRFATSNYLNGGRHPIGLVDVKNNKCYPLSSDFSFDDPAMDTSLHYEIK